MLRYKVDNIEKGYYADGEDAYAMKCTFTSPPKEKKKRTKVTTLSSSNPIPDAASAESTSTVSQQKSSEIVGDLNIIEEGKEKRTSLVTETSVVTDLEALKLASNEPS
jgi:hypothetical protein